MSLLGKSALALVIPAAGALMAGATGTAHAANLYGAIAAGSNQVFHAVDYPTQAAADDAVFRACGGNWCEIKLRIQNSCGAVAESGSAGLWGNQPVFYYGTGPTAADAEQMAMSQVPAGWWGATVIRLFWGSSMTTSPFIKDSVCTSNAG